MHACSCSIIDLSPIEGALAWGGGRLLGHCSTPSSPPVAVVADDSRCCHAPPPPPAHPQEVQRTALRAIRNVAWEGVNKDTLCYFGGLPAIFTAMDTHLDDPE